MGNEIHKNGKAKFVNCGSAWLKRYIAKLFLPCDSNAIFAYINTILEKIRLLLSPYFLLLIRPWLFGVLARSSLLL